MPLLYALRDNLPGKDSINKLMRWADRRDGRTMLAIFRIKKENPE